MTTDSDDFERAFVAVSYLIDRRGDDLTRALGGGSDTRLQILFKSNGGGGHDNLQGEDQNVALK